MSICRSLWDLWSDDQFTPPLLRCSLDRIEPFDEWEEFALFAKHYFLLVASNLPSEVPTQPPEQQNSNVAAQCIDNHNALISYVNLADNPLAPRRFGATFTMDQDTIALHGGQGMQKRLTSIDVLRRQASGVDFPPDSVPQTRMCHTFTNISDTEALLIGGRLSPSHALTECWLIKSGKWQQVQDLSPARFRHCATKVKMPSKDSEIEAVLVFGGKTSEGKILDKWCIWMPDAGWQNIPVVGPCPPARFGAALSSMHYAPRGLLVGGAGAGGTVFDDMWQWSLDAAPVLQLTFTNLTNAVKSLPGNRLHARLGASLLPLGQSLILIGGIAKEDILSPSEEFLEISNQQALRISKANITIPESAYPLLVGFSATAISPHEILITGGGAVCFSMGSFWNKGFLSITTVDTCDPQQWSVAVHQPEVAAQTQPPAEQSVSTKSKGKDKDKGEKKKTQTETRVSAAMKITTATVRRLKPQSSDDFVQLLTASKPAILEGLDIGPCTKLWTLDYLKEKVGADRELVVHECGSDRMTFRDKNFQYIKKSLGDFLDGIAKGEKMYLRAVSANQPNKLPTKLEEDFPTIAPDFHLPEILTYIKENYHSSPLRISGPVSLWLHYDVLANVLCQVKGTKVLHLYPPSDVKYLDFPPGGSSSNLDVLSSKDPMLQNTHPHIAFLAPGDILFIPPMWAHTATPSEGISIAVNTFFRNLSEGYAAGKDVYGNRDLQAYENGRRDMDRILKAFKTLPGDIARFYLDRLVDELKDKAANIDKS